MSDVWERTIRTMKDVMYKMVKNVVFMDYQLQTVFTEIQNIVNNRPLIHVIDNCNNTKPLTPNIFLIGKFGSDSDSFLNTTEPDLSSGKQWRQNFGNNFGKVE